MGKYGTAWENFCPIRPTADALAPRCLARPLTPQQGGLTITPLPPKIFRRSMAKSVMKG